MNLRQRTAGRSRHNANPRVTSSTPKEASGTTLFFRLATAMSAIARRLQYTQ